MSSRSSAVDHVLSGSRKQQHASERSHSFLQALSDTSHNPKQLSEDTYIHPLVKKLSAKLSAKSLEMCTESLGSETGSEIIYDPLINSSSMIHRKNTKTVRKTKHSYNFPPPLKSIDHSVRVKSHRENGRLVINMVTFTETSNSLFHAERVNGRLRLRTKKIGLEKGDEMEHGMFETEDSVSWGKELNVNMELMEGKSGIDENMSTHGRCNEADKVMKVKGHLWNVETCSVAI